MEEERHPKNMQGLLRFAMELTKAEDAPNPSQFQQMDEERKKFLEEVISSMTVDIIEEFRKALTVLEFPESSDNEKLDALESIREFIDHIDYANNFVKLGGMKVVISCLSSKNAQIRKSAATVIGEISQNNPFCQARLGNADLFQKLIELLEDDAVAGSAMHAISCLIRHHEPSLTAFTEIGGLECLIACAASEKERVSVKACFLISALANDSKIKDKLVEMGVIERLAVVLKPVDNFNVQTESVLSALNVITADDDGRKRFQKSNTKDTLVKIVDLCANKDECEEIVQFSRNLLSLYTSTPEDSTDR